MFALTVAICLLPSLAIAAADLFVETTDKDELLAMDVVLKR